MQDAHAGCPTATTANATYNLGPVPPSTTYTITALYAQTETAPGAGKSWVVNVRDNGATVFSCTVSGTDQSCSSTGSVSVAAGHFLQVEMTTANTAANGKWKVLLTFSQ